MDYKYNAVNELNHFDFAEAVVGDIQLLGKMFHIVIDNVKILPENSFNRDIRTMRTNGMLFKIEGAEIISVVEEGFNTYDADGNLQKTVEDRKVEKEEYDKISDTLVDGMAYMHSLSMETMRERTNSRLQEAGITNPGICL